jgi:hypothetical protein
MKRACWVAVASLLLASACSPSGDAPAVEGAPASAVSGAPLPEDFRATLNNKELMAHVIDAAADGVWLNQGWVVSDKGEEELFPTTDAGWLAAENAAATLAEATNLLLLPGRPADEDRAWIEYTHQLHDASIKAMKMAEARDKQGFFDAGGEMYVACRSCHQRYIIGEVQ